jgi:hypothetical protein
MKYSLHRRAIIVITLSLIALRGSAGDATAARRFGCDEWICYSNFYCLDKGQVADICNASCRDDWSGKFACSVCESNVVGLYCVSEPN